ncbi:MAG TPA: S9 family peptidase [Egicoccus sp.]|nr:S9 family peptidase [Egicoccus sp.]HSK22252.1 S9 family peptidase [Egicoccus sp.]
MSQPFTDYVPLQRFQPVVAVSPDGTQVAYSCNRAGQYHLWVAPVGGGQPRALTDDADLAVRAMVWHPDGDRLVFMADRDGDEQYQLFEVEAVGGAPRLLTEPADRQHVLADDPFGPRGEVLVYAANDREPGVQDLLVRRDGEVRRLESEPGVMLFPAAVSPDGRWVSVTAARSNTDSDVAVVDLHADTLALTVLTAHEGEAQHIAGPWRADSEALYVRTDLGREFTGLSLQPIGGAPAEPVEQPEWDVEHVAGAAPDDGHVVVFSVNESGRSVLHVRRDGSPAEVVDLPSGEIDALALTRDGATAVVLVNTATRPSDVMAVDLGSGRVDHLTDSRPEALADLDPVAPELVAYPTHDGRDIPAWLYRPRGDGPFPVVVSVHGGPEAQERPIWSYAGLYQYLLANGIGILAPNVRGSTGYGATYQRLIHRDWGGAELGDLDHAARWLGSLDWVDAGRLAVFGGSFGGFAALSCLSRLPEHWAAGVSIVGPSNLVTFARSVPPTWRPLMAALVGDPENDVDMLTERSPLTYADAIVAPLFVIQGAKDPRVVKAESDQMVERLRARGVEVRYDVYDDEGHGFTRRENEIRALSDVGDFLVEHLVGDRRASG